ncbi:MAG: HD domain-containing protein [Acidobacteriota bacterium]|nr:HD domain-containing protein [Acidobacteriota bacterium]
MVTCGIAGNRGVPTRGGDLATEGAELSLDSEFCFSYRSLEDCGGEPRLRDIRRRFGHVVADIVDGCSGTDAVSEPDYRKRKQRYIEHLEEASPSVRPVSAADKLANIRSIITDCRAVGDGLWARFNAPKVDQLWYYGSLSKAFSRLGPTSVARELEEALAELLRLTGESPVNRKEAE